MYSFSITPKQLTILQIWKLHNCKNKPKKIQFDFSGID